MTQEERNKAIEKFLEKCNFIGSKTVKITQQEADAIKECRDKANLYDGFEVD